MGYILPITNHSYVNYHYRMLASRSSPHYIGEPNKITYPIIQQGHNDFYKQFQPHQIEQYQDESGETNRDSSSVNKKRHHIIDQEVKALLTGKGIMLNERV